MSHPYHSHDTVTSPNDNAAGNMVMPTPSKFSFTMATQQASKFSMSNYSANINNSHSVVGSGTNNPYRTSLGASNHHQQQQQQQQQQQSSSTTVTHPPDGIENSKNNANTGSFSAAPTSSSSQDLESKLHNTAASFRKSRDEAHRHHTIAQERLRIVKEEYQTLQASVQSLQQHLQSMQQTYANDQSKYQGLQTEVQQLSNEVRFQHAELISKRNQLQDQRTNGPLGPSASAERQAILDQLQQTVQSQREKLQMMNRGSSSGTGPALLHGTVLVDHLKEHIPEGQTEIPIAVLRRWNRLLEQSGSKIKDQIHDRSQRTNGDIQKLKFLEEKYGAFIAAHQSNDMTTTPTKKNDRASNHPSTDDDHRDTLMADVVPTNDAIMTETIRLDPPGPDDDFPPLVPMDVTDAPMMTTTTTTATDDELIVVDEPETSNMSHPVATPGPTSGHTRVHDDEAVVTSEAMVM